jgi:hypothetical protein
MTRSFSRDDWEASLAEWDAGEFSDEWKPYRHQAAMRGIIFPPDGTRWDSWDDESPSQRAMLIRAIRDTPELLRAAIDRPSSRSWSDVITYILARRDEWRAEIELADRDATRRKAEWPDEREAAKALKAIMNRIADS